MFIYTGDNFVGQSLKGVDEPYKNAPVCRYLYI
jgi:hypothetical protein